MIHRASRWVTIAIGLAGLTASTIRATGSDRPATSPAADFTETWLLHLPGIGGVDRWIAGWYRA